MDTMPSINLLISTVPLVFKFVISVFMYNVPKPQLATPTPEPQPQTLESH